MELANIVSHAEFSNVSVEIKVINKNLRDQLLALLQESLDGRMNIGLLCDRVCTLSLARLCVVSGCFIGVGSVSLHSQRVAPVSLPPLRKMRSMVPTT